MELAGVPEVEDGDEDDIVETDGNFIYSLRHGELAIVKSFPADDLTLLSQTDIEGDPVGGVLPSGTVAGVISDRPGCAELIERIVNEAERTLEALAN